MEHTLLCPLLVSVSAAGWEHGLLTCWLPLYMGSDIPCICFLPAVSHVAQTCCVLPFAYYADEPAGKTSVYTRRRLLLTSMGGTPLTSSRPSRMRMPSGLRCSPVPLAASEVQPASEVSCLLIFELF